MAHAMICETIFLFIILNVINVAGDHETAVTHSLIYIYMELSKDLSSLGFFEFTSLGLLDNRQIYNSKTQVQVPKPEAGLSDWTQELWGWRDWFRHQSDTLGNCTWPCPDLHVLQRRYGCEVQKHHDGLLELLRSVDEYGYDGEDFISFDAHTMQWKAEVPKAQTTKIIWDHDKGRISHIKVYLEKECVDILGRFLIYKNSLKIPHCFYPKDVMMSVTKNHTTLPEELITSSGVRPNDDDTYQLRKSVDILENEKADYDCYVTHSSLYAPLSTKWEGKCSDCLRGQSGIIGGVIVVLLTLALVFYCLIKIHEGDGHFFRRCDCFLVPPRL